MTTFTQPQPKIASREEWLIARKALLAKEKAMTRELDALRAERRQLPWVRVEKDYVFEGPHGRCTLADLFRGRSQLAVYHFMLTPGSDRICHGCAYIADHIDGARQHFGQADLAFAAISRVPLERIEQVRRRLGWTFPWVSSQGTDFNFDFGVSFRKEDIAAGRAIYNYGTPVRQSEDMHGTSIFARNDAGEVFHTYSTFARGDEVLMGAHSWLDLTPKGRNEAGGWSLSMAWLPICGQTWAGAAASFIGMWAVMMVAMMLPSLTPALWRGRPASGALRPLLLMAMGYFLVWILPGAIVFPVGAGFAELLQRHPALARAVPVLAGCVVAGAGLLQFTAWKARHLARCRRMADDRLPMGAGAALRRGLRLGRHCTCSCAGFTAVLLAIGVMDLRAMALIMAAITAERLAGDGIARSIGAVLLAAGLLLIARAAGLG